MAEKKWRYEYRPKPEVKVYRGVRGKVEERARILAAKWRKADKRDMLRKISMQNVARNIGKYQGTIAKYQKKARKYAGKSQGFGGFDIDLGSGFNSNISILEPTKKSKRRRNPLDLSI